MLSLFFLLSATGRADSSEQHSYFEHAYTTTLFLQNDQERDIAIDHNYVTVIFQLPDKVEIDAYVMDGKEKAKIGKMNQKNKRYALHSGKSLIFLTIKSDINTNVTMHILLDDENCNQTFISTRNSEKFAISDRGKRNITAESNQEICFFHAPSETVQYSSTIFDSSSNFRLSVYQNGHEEERVITSDTNDVDKISGHILFVWKIFENSIFPFWSYSSKHNNPDYGFSLSYKKSNETFYIKPDGIENVIKEAIPVPTIKPESLDDKGNDHDDKNDEGEKIIDKENKVKDKDIEDIDKKKPPINNENKVEKPRQKVDKGINDEGENQNPNPPENRNNNEPPRNNGSRITIDLSTTAALLFIIAILLIIIICVALYVFVYNPKPVNITEQIGLLTGQYREGNYEYSTFPQPQYFPQPPMYEYQIRNSVPYSN